MKFGNLKLHNRNNLHVTHNEQNRQTAEKHKKSHKLFSRHNKEAFVVQSQPTDSMFHSAQQVQDNKQNSSRFRRAVNALRRAFHMDTTKSSSTSKILNTKLQSTHTKMNKPNFNQETYAFVLSNLIKSMQSDKSITSNAERVFTQYTNLSSEELGNLFRKKLSAKNLYGSSLYHSSKESDAFNKDFFTLYRNLKLTKIKAQDGIVRLYFPDVIRLLLTLSTEDTIPSNQESLASFEDAKREWDTAWNTACNMARNMNLKKTLPSQ